MSDTVTLKRIIDLVTQADIDSGVYTIIDSVSGAVKKYPLGSLICSIAPIFDATEDYSAGAYCNYNGQLYRFTEAHAAGDWDGSDAEAVTVTDVMATAAELAGKADVDGTYEYLTAGLAEQILSDVSVTDKKPYLFRKTGADATREYDTLVGGSVVNNQLVDSGTTSVTLTSGHKYYTVISGTATIQAGSGSAVSVTGGTDIVTDLTQMFGSTIADYVYTLEQATEGSGIAWLKSYGFFSGYQAYNAGAMVHVSGVEAHVMTGFNQWDEVLDDGGINDTTGEKITVANQKRSKNYIKALPATQYYVTYLGVGTGGIYLYAYDATFAFIGRVPVYNSPTVFNVAGHLVYTPENTAYLLFKAQAPSGGNYDGICINLSGSRNGQYEPYTEYSYTLDDTLTLRGILKLSNGEIYYDGDTYGHDGTVTRKYGIRAYQAGDESLTDAITDGTNTVYKLQTPTTESATSYQSPQICDPDGTEEYITDGIPVGHETQYPANLKGEIERVMVQVPKAPSANGTYTLKCTVSGGAASYAWSNA